MYQQYRQAPRHKVFISFYHADQSYKDWFLTNMGDDIVDKSVGDGDIDDNKPTDTIRERIRDDFIADATVTVVLVGPCTWQRKHVDWEIGSSLRKTKRNSRCGLLGLLLPNHTNYYTDKCDPHLIPPRLADNCGGNDPYARIYKLITDRDTIRAWIHTAYERRFGTAPYNWRPQYKHNRSGICYEGWRD